MKQFEVKIDSDCEYSVNPPGKRSFTPRILDFEGRLKIVDTDRLQKALFEGIDSAKAFGCGLMLVRRI